ncbi:SDR family NAD(P)-dependent oxidoreductase [Microbacterium album]|uniref:Short-chain dehydrogenase n=1 Tax=Microbacterium album TaxID=2053191 RepID=A0A917IF60_9MICO|nr:SDR family NAD(P)-dependent oxidoreductase [Microbacterium album]GGH47160.1 short-chain dehydrogenase [Microbacterium album]
MTQLEGRVAIITGAAGGIGSAVARRYSEEGARLVLADIVGDRVEAVAETITEAGGTAVAVTCDVAKEVDIDKVVQTAVENYGQIDIMANIAQGAMGDMAYLDETTIDQATTNFVTGPLQSMLFMQKCLPHMKERGYGRIINTASHSAVMGAPGFAPYEMAKGAIMALTRNASQEWAKYGIVANTFMPVVRTPAYDLSEQGRAAAESMAANNPTGRFGTPYEDLTPVLVFLASEGAGYVNGQLIGVDGGGFLIA